jgi:hypothetical protein
VIDDDLRIRARRLLSDDHRTQDLDRLFLGLRDRSLQSSCFREIGDFVAHRDTREKALISQVGQDVITSLDVWSLKRRGSTPALPQLLLAANANLRLASDSQLKKLTGHSRQKVSKLLTKVMGELKANTEPHESEVEVLTNLGSFFIWRPAFSANQLFDEFCEVLTQNKIIAKTDIAVLIYAKEFITLYALALIHGSSIVLNNGEKAKLFAGYANKDKILEIKIDIVFKELVKPIYAPICLFLTELPARIHCNAELIFDQDPVLVDHWNFLIEVGLNGKLVKLK